MKRFLLASLLLTLLSGCKDKDVINLKCTFSEYKDEMDANYKDYNPIENFPTIINLNKETKKGFWYISNKEKKYNFNNVMLTPLLIQLEWIDESSDYGYSYRYKRSYEINRTNGVINLTSQSSASELGTQKSFSSYWLRGKCFLSKDFEILF